MGRPPNRDTDHTGFDGRVLYALSQFSSASTYRLVGYLGSSQQHVFYALKRLESLGYVELARREWAVTRAGKLRLKSGA